MSKGNVPGCTGTGLRQFSGIDSVTDISGNNIQALSSNTIVQGNTTSNPSLALVGSGPINYTGGGALTVSGKIFGGAQSVDMTPSFGTFNATFSGPFASPITTSFNWVKQGREVTLHGQRAIGPPPAVATNQANAAAGTVPAALIPVNAGSPADVTQFVWVEILMFTGNAIPGSSCHLGLGSDGSILVLSAANWVTTGIGSSGGWSAFSMRYQTAS